MKRSSTKAKATLYPHPTKLGWLVAQGSKWFEMENAAGAWIARVPVRSPTADLEAVTILEALRAAARLTGAPIAGAGRPARIEDAVMLPTVRVPRWVRTELDQMAAVTRLSIGEIIRNLLMANLESKS